MTSSSCIVVLSSIVSSIVTTLLLLLQVCPLKEGARVFVREENEEVGETTWWSGAVKSVQVDRVSVVLEGADSDGEACPAHAHAHVHVHVHVYVVSVPHIRMPLR